MVDIDGCHPRDLITTLFFNDLHSFHSSFIEEYTGGLLMVLQKQDGGIHSPILCEEVASGVSKLTRLLSGMRRLRSFYSLFKQQVSEMVPHTTLRSSRFFMIILIPPQILMILK